MLVGTSMQMDILQEIKSSISYNHNFSSSVHEYDVDAVDAPPAIVYHPFKEENCALLFFGVPKCFEQASMSIKKNIVDMNPNCDIYLHTYNLTVLPGNPRNKERQVKVDIKKVYQLTNNVTMTDMEEFSKRRNLTYYRKHFPTVGAWSYPVSMDNMIKQWHSIESVWNYMETTSQQFYQPNNTNNKYYYNRVGIFRIDQIYLNPINISNSIAVEGDFNMKGEEKKLMTSDRLFYGLYNNARIWATGRFPYVESYLKLLMGKKRGLHSESFLYQLTRNKIGVVKKEHICAQRIRNNCAKHAECKGFTVDVESSVFEDISDKMIRDSMLQKNAAKNYN